MPARSASCRAAQANSRAVHHHPAGGAARAEEREEKLQLALPLEAADADDLAAADLRLTS